MVVVCESCSTRFRVDESQIPPKGTLVRCSRCKATFIVKVAEPSFEETVQDVVAEVTEAGGEPVPAPSEDLFEQAPDDLGSTLGGPEEDSWEFDEGPPAHAPQPELAPPPDAALLDTDPPEAAWGEPVSSDTADTALPETDLQGTALPESDLPDTAPPEAGLLDTAPPELGPEFSKPVQDDLGPPDDWDLLGDSSVDAAASGATFVEAPEETPAAGEEASPAPAIASLTEDETQPAARTPASERLDALSRRLVAAGRGALRVTAWAGVLAALGVGLFASLPRGPQALPLASTHELVPLPDGEARDVQVRFVENAFAGTIYVVQGELVRLAADPTLGLRVHWRDASGATLGDGVWAQALPPTRALRERAPESWHQSRAGIAAAPARGAFAAIFSELPAGASGVAISLERLPRSALPPEDSAPGSEGPGTAQPEPSGAATTAPSSPSPLPSAG